MAFDKHYYSVPHTLIGKEVEVRATEKNDSGRSLSDEPWQQSDRVTILHNERRERSFARNSGAAVAVR